MSRPASAITASSPDGAGAATSIRSCGTSFTPVTDRQPAQRSAAGGADAPIAVGVAGLGGICFLMTECRLCHLHSTREFGDATRQFMRRDYPPRLLQCNRQIKLNPMQLQLL